MNPSDQELLMTWYRLHHRDLPWRQDRDPYRVLVSEFMLQQTTVAAVVPLYERWMSRFPTIEALAAAEVADVMEAWSGLGYYQRARRLHQTAQILAERTEFPATILGWQELPGLGPYTAAAVTSIAYRLPYLALDTNALRVLLRYYGSDAPAEKASTHRALKDRLESRLEQVDPGLFNQAVMELGALYCTPKAPSCSLCPLSSGCLAKAGGHPEALPRRKAKKPAKITPVAAYLVLDQSCRLLLIRGTPIGLLQDLYQPPIDVFEENRQDWEGSKLLLHLQEQRERLGISATASLNYSISGRLLKISVYQVPWAEPDERGARQLNGDADYELTWVRPKSPDEKGAISTLTRRIISAWSETQPTLRPKDDRSEASSPSHVVHRP